MASSDYLQQAESFSSMDEIVKPESLGTTSCALINETPSSKAGKDELYICPRCEDVDFPSLFSSQEPPVHVPLQHRGSDDLDPECGICRLLRVAWPQGNRFQFQPPYYLTFQFDDPRNIGISGTYGGHIFGADMSLRRIWEIPFVALNKVAAAKIDFPIIKSWVEDCSHNHGPECAATWHRDSIPGLKLIKIRERRIVNALQEGGPYAALSYVWGTDPQGSPQGDKLPAEMPKTIADAMNVALELDIEYLWIDRYCIQQDGPEEKMDQISKMHHIYRQSHVTIIAAAGDGPDHGIPGMGIPRTPTLTTINGRLFFAGTFTYQFAAKIPESKWHTRAWTYQEQILSRRFILFTDSQSFFHCNQTQTSWHFGIEDPIQNLERAEDRRLRCVLPRESDKFDESRSNYEKGTISLHVNEINWRDLTYENDRVNTIAGILGHLQCRGVIAGHLSGSPILREHLDFKNRELSWEEGFLSGIAAYRRSRECDRREEFPSWSWAGWKGVGDYDRGFLVSEHDVRIWIELDPTVTSILNSVDDVDVPNLSASSSGGSNLCLSSKEFEKIAQRLIFKDSTCRFIRIEAPIIHCQLKRIKVKPRLPPRWVVDSVEGYQMDEWCGRKVEFLSQVDHGSDQERELLSSPLKGLFMIRENFREPRGYVIFVKRLDDYFEMVACWSFYPTELPIFLHVRDGEGSIRPLLEYDSGEKPETDVLVKKEIIRLG